jgi:hypothetical protein
MDIRRPSLRLVSVAAVVVLALLGVCGVASAKVKPAGCHKTHSCRSGGGGGSGVAPAPITVQIDPNPLIETGTSDVVATVQVETNPAFAGDPVDVSSSQLFAACEGDMSFATADLVLAGRGSVELILDDDGNATAIVLGEDCAPGPSVVEADLMVAPYDTATATLHALPPVVTAPGVTGYPTTSGTVAGGEVETGDTSFPDAGSYAYGVFYVETDAVYAEMPVEISSPELQSRCGTGAAFETPTQRINDDGVTTTLDDDGNAVFYFVGSSCAAGTSTVIADVEAGDHPTYVTTFTILPPQPTI